MSVWHVARLSSTKHQGIHRAEHWKPFEHFSASRKWSTIAGLGGLPRQSSRLLTDIGHGTASILILLSSYYIIIITFVASTAFLAVSCCTVCNYGRGEDPYTTLVDIIPTEFTPF